MKRVILIGSLGFLFSSCGVYQEHRQKQNIVNETYYHKYGVEVPQQDWDTRGKHGRVVTELVNGVTVTRSYNAGQLDGEVTYSFPHTQKIERSENYTQGQLISEKEFYSSGIPSKEVQYLSPTTRTVTTWYESGTPRCQERYESGFLLSGEYYTLNNQVETKVINGAGTRVSRDEWGQLLSHDTIQEGEMALQQTYHPNSTPKEKIPYVDGKIEGQKPIYLPTGEPKAIEEWAKNQQHGKTILFENGEMIAEVPYLEGKKCGIERRFKDGEEVVEEITWRRNRRHGPSVTYLGGRTQVDWYHEGKRVNKNQYENLNKASQ